MTADSPVSLRLDGVSRWYGNVVAVNDVTMEIKAGVTGLLGPNGAGKSTLIHLMSGFLPPSSGTVTLQGEPTWHNEQIYRRIGLVPEREAMYDGVTGWDFVLYNAGSDVLERDPLSHLMLTPADMAERDLFVVTEVRRRRIPLAMLLSGGYGPRSWEAHAQSIEGILTRFDREV